MKNWLLVLISLLLIIGLSYFCSINKSKEITKESTSIANSSSIEKSKILINTNELNDKVTPSPFIDKPLYRISAIKKIENKVIIIKGSIADKKTHDQLIKKAKNLFGYMNVIDELEENVNAPIDWFNSAELGLEKLKIVDYGHFEIINNRFNFIGHLQNEKQKSILLNDFYKKLNKNYVGNYKIQIPNKKESTLSCQENFNYLFKNQKIHFKYNQSILTKDSLKLLTKLSKVIKTHCINNYISIEGHTDSDGKKRYNQQLSEKRAKNIKQYLLSKNINPNQLEAIGYGERKPIVSNNTKAGKKKNRRIEFIIKTAEIKKK